MIFRTEKLVNNYDYCQQYDRHGCRGKSYPRSQGFYEQRAFAVNKCKQQPRRTHHRHCVKYERETPPPALGAEPVAFETYPRTDGHIQHLPEGTHYKYQQSVAAPQLLEAQRYDLGNEHD